MKIVTVDQMRAIEQRSAVANPRSTVATTTELYDFLRLLYARAGSRRVRS